MASAFRAPCPGAGPVRKLYQVKGKRNIRASERDVTWGSFNTGDCFILDLGQVGAGASPLSPPLVPRPFSSGVCILLGVHLSSEVSIRVSLSLLGRLSMRRVCLSECPSVYESICPSICLVVWVSLCWDVCLSVLLSISLLGCLTPSRWLPVHRTSVCPWGCLSVLGDICLLGCPSICWDIPHP